MNSHSQFRTKEWLSYLFNFPLGICLGSIATFFLFAIFDADITNKLREYYTYLFSLVASMLVAALALSGVLYNVANQNRNEAQKTLRALRAARSIFFLSW